MALLPLTMLKCGLISLSETLVFAQRYCTLSPFTGPPDDELLATEEDAAAPPAPLALDDEAAAPPAPLEDDDADADDDEADVDEADVDATDDDDELTATLDEAPLVGPGPEVGPGPAEVDPPLPPDPSGRTGSTPVAQAPTHAAPNAERTSPFAKLRPKLMPLIRIAPLPF